MFHFFSDEPPGCSVNDAWIASLVKSGDFLAQQSTGRLVMVLASARFACLVWEVTVQHNQNGESCFLCKPDGNAVHWQFLVDVQDWLLVPATPILLSDKGPIAWKRSADAMSLPQALCLQGCAINKEQLLQLIKQLNGTPPKGTNKRTLQEFLIAHVLSPAEQVVALQQFQTATSAPWEDDVDSDFSEILSELDKDEANSGDINDKGLCDENATGLLVLQQQLRQRTQGRQRALLSPLQRRLLGLHCWMRPSPRRAPVLNCLASPPHRRALVLLALANPRHPHRFFVALHSRRKELALPKSTKAPRSCWAGWRHPDAHSD